MPRESSPFLTTDDNLVAVLAAWAVFAWTFRRES